jgi:hypothetical protein
MRPAQLASKENPAMVHGFGGVPGPCAFRIDNVCLGPPGQRLPAITCSRNRAAPQFGHWALRSEGAWGIRVSPLSCVTQPRLAQDRRGFFVKCAFTPAASFLRMPSWPPHASRRSRVRARDFTLSGERGVVIVVPLPRLGGPSTAPTQRNYATLT